MFSGTKVFDYTKNIQQQKQIIQMGVANASLRFYYINLTEVHLLYIQEYIHTYWYMKFIHTYSKIILTIIKSN